MNKEEHSSVTIIHIFAGAVAVTDSYFGSGEGPYVSRSTHCNEHTRHLAYYGRTGIYDYTAECSPGHDAGVICKGM